MFGRLLLLFVIVPLVELVILIQLGQAIGLWPTLALVFGTGFAGAALARAEGLRTLLELRREVGAGRVPGRQLLDGLAILVGGAFLLTPGLLTDVAGLGLLFPPTRRWLQGRVRGWLEDQLQAGHLKVSVLRWGPGGPLGTAPDEEQPAPGLDPRKEIRVPPPE